MIKFNIMPMLRAKGRTRYWLAKETGMSYPNIAKLVDGKTLAVRLETIEALCQVLECTPNDRRTPPNSSQLSSQLLPTLLPTPPNSSASY